MTEAITTELSQDKPNTLRLDGPDVLDPLVIDRAAEAAGRIVHRLDALKEAGESLAHEATDILTGADVRPLSRDVTLLTGGELGYEPEDAKGEEVVSQPIRVENGTQLDITYTYLMRERKTANGGRIRELVAHSHRPKSFYAGREPGSSYRGMGISEQNTYTVHAAWPEDGTVVTPYDHLPVSLETVTLRERYTQTLIAIMGELVGANRSAA